MKMSFDYDYPKEYLVKYQEIAREVSLFGVRGILETNDRMVHIRESVVTRCDNGLFEVAAGDYIVEFSEEIPEGMTMDAGKILRGWTLIPENDIKKPRKREPTKFQFQALE